MSTVLIVDDEPDIRDSVKRWLQFAGMRTHLAVDGVECLQLVDEVRPDLIIMDVLMPRMDGLTAIRELRGGSEVSTTPILVLSASLADENEAYIAGANRVLGKPYQGRQLINTVKELLSDEQSVSGDLVFNA
ncbi:response regulator [Rhodopirellula sp. P2]|uniref:response regulator n=1 Tax=Rhodopirellula sp. P2 TaxID=2127060 RepID=UPI002368A121|nr:response regulator [Rhodopirellula sp. P2]WDQ14556.1 response regulator [Rhodopirellula sp. P2]